MSRGSDEAQVAAVFILLEERNISEHVPCLFLDTTASNVGHKTGACTILERKLNKDLISLLCRAHLHELILAKAFCVLNVETSSGPDIKLFQRFYEYWQSIDREAYERGMSENSVTKKCKQ